VARATEGLQPEDGPERQPQRNDRRADSEPAPPTADPAGRDDDRQQRDGLRRSEHRPQRDVRG
jgi:hypothetical protein